jgi:hypothetical protein
MRVILFFLLLCGSVAYGQARFVVDKPMHKFPKVNEGVQLEHAFTVTNAGDEPLIISSYEVECSCTKVVLPGTIAPGEMAEIVVKFDTNGKYRFQDRDIILHTNTKRQVEYLSFKAYVIPEGEPEN